MTCDLYDIIFLNLIYRMDALASNGTYKETFNIMDNPIIRFPDQTEPTHRQLVFLKCFMLAVMEHKVIAQTLILRLQSYLTAGYVGLVCVMLALSSELAWTAFPFILFCYSCQTLKLFAFESNLRRCISLIFNVMCCIEVAGFEFVFDVYFILGSFGMALFSLYVKKDGEGKDRDWLVRVSSLLVLLIEAALFYYSNIVDYKYTLFVNAALTLYEAFAVSRKIFCVILMYNIMSQLILVASIYEFDVDAHFDLFINSVWNYLIQYSGIV